MRLPIRIKRTKLLLFSIAIIFGLVLCLHTFFFPTSQVQGESMAPTIKDGERVIFNKLAYIIDEPKRGDIVMIDRPIKKYVKRIIGVPGDRVQIKEQKLYINGEIYQQLFIQKNKREETTDYGPIVVPQDSYFVMGDNRMVSKDSRTGLGFIKMDEIVGRSEYIIHPFTSLSRTQ
ncbi:signal peptidase I [Aquibacillus koreensis]|uniref:Signal peptidase I n=1 Tax=Aquibacillus koreensis TaxID=279446 RepID=A0A9X3WJ17_9BACI|nr:signal peptidase I [Aquibacillus koreensis]MCT2534341.1 signal peptidase I [Aquibacillus koreensis]MDC3420662.1 signal peptidase I [Aquibacillus koreensis]